MRRSYSWSWHHLRIVVIAVLYGWLASCGNDKTQDEDSGGDHIPDDKVYTLTSLPDGVTASGLARKELAATFLRRFVRLSPRYRICLPSDAIDDESFQRLDDWMARRSGKTSTFGLEAVINKALGAIDRFDPAAKPSVGRIEIDLLRLDAAGASCHALLTRTSASEFPFNHEDFSSQSRVFLETNRLRTDAGDVNRVPVGYVDRALSDADFDIAAQYLIGTFLGLGESSLTDSYLSQATDAAASEPGYFMDQANGFPRWDDDAQILYGFALAHRDVIKTRDLDTLHHYQDQLSPTENDQDPDLSMPAQARPIEFVEAIGDPSVRGARVIADELPICVKNLSGVTIDAAAIAAYFDFVAPDAEGSVIYHLAARESAIKTRAKLVADGCSLVVVMKNGDQYPFTEKDINGLYAHEGSVKTKTGKATTLPVIYLNTAFLDLDPDQEARAASLKPLPLVLQHEFAHFLGMRHSTSDHSLLSPAGYNATWDEAGGDGSMFDAFVKYWRKG